MIADRFTMSEDVEWFDQSIAKLVGEKLGEKNQKIVDCGLDRYFVDFLRDAPEDTGIDPLLLSSSVNCLHLFFCINIQNQVLFCTGEEKEDADLEMPKVYEPIKSFESLKKRLNMFLTQYNETVRGTGMDMVFFQDAMIHLIKVL